MIRILRLQKYLLPVKNVRQFSNVHKRKNNNPKVYPTEIAMNHYDSFYSKVYGSKWQSIRLGLLSPNKYSAIINSFCKEEIEIQMRQLGAYDLKYIYSKNNERIEKHRQKLLVLKNRKKELNGLNRNTNNCDKSSENDDPSAFLASSESEFEGINHFLSESQDLGEPFRNEASMNLNLSEFMPVSEMKYKEEQEISDLDYYQFYDMSNEIDNLERTSEPIFYFPEELAIFSFMRNDFQTFPHPKIASNNLMSYYLFDAASTLPVLLLDIHNGNHVADFCAAPGGKSLLMVNQKLNRCRFLLNDQSNSRFLRMKRVFDSFIPENHQENIQFTNYDASKIRAFSNFDRILVDVPCTNDRHSLYVSDNNIFSTKRISERVQMPFKQLDLLINALRCVKPGGAVVYSTCSLSPIQNDGVVHQALLQLSNEDSFTIMNLKDALRPFRGLFHFDHSFKYGTQVLPHISSNFGPMYFAKIVKNN